MSSRQSSAAAPASEPQPVGGGGGGGAGRVLHARSFKLRFAAQREPGRSNVSAFRPRGLPALVADKFYRVASPDAAGASAGARLEALLARGGGAQLSSHEYGRWAARATRPDPRLDQRIRDSWWLKSRVAVLAADAKLERR